MYGERFLHTQAFLNVIRHEEIERLTHEMLDLKHRGDWDTMYAKHEDRELTQREVWDRAIEEAVLILDARMERLGDS